MYRIVLYGSKRKVNVANEKIIYGLKKKDLHFYIKILYFQYFYLYFYYFLKDKKRSNNFKIKKAEKNFHDFSTRTIPTQWHGRHCTPVLPRKTICSQHVKTTRLELCRYWTLRITASGWERKWGALLKRHDLSGHHNLSAMVTWLKFVFEKFLYCTNNFLYFIRY